MIGSQSTKAIHFLHAASLNLSSCGVWAIQKDNIAITAIEAYPAAARNHPFVVARSEELIAQIPAGPKGLDADTKDALTCAIVAHLFSDLPGSYEPVPNNVPEQEGWIIVPRPDWSVLTK